MSQEAKLGKVTYMVVGDPHDVDALELRRPSKFREYVNRMLCTYDPGFAHSLAAVEIRELTEAQLLSEEMPTELPRIVCEQCHKDVEVLATMFRPAHRTCIAHVKCHRDERLIEIRGPVLDAVSLTWGQLTDYLTSEDALSALRDDCQHMAQQEWKLAGMAASVLRSRR